jgi:hypothetical protein
MTFKVGCGEIKDSELNGNHVCILPSFKIKILLSSERLLRIKQMPISPH